MGEGVSSPRRDLFGDIAVGQAMLTWAQVRDILRRQSRYKGMGIPIRIGEVAVEMGLLTSVQRNEILAVQAQRRKPSAPPTRAGDSQVFDRDYEIGEAYQFGRFRLDKRLGGVMGVVYHGVDSQSGKTIALKVLPRSLAFDAALVERFKREVRATSTLSHPNIVHVFDAGVERGVFYLAMEFIDGETLAERLRREERLPELECLRIARDVARGLLHAHAQNVLHRDVKPDNIMLARSGVAKLADFGLAKLLADQQQITAEGIAVGTPHYIAPEQARAAPDIDHRADLYSLGATLFHVITGRVPFEGDDGAEIMRRHVFEPMPDPRSARPEITAGTAAMLMKLMAKDPRQRYQSALELIAYLDGVLGPEDQIKTTIAAPPEHQGAPSIMPRRLSASE